ncbi:MAG TPA: response regulator [Burkholderiales bacterium]|nr:response regulator [Burkholderiales bacterium]
MNNLHIRILHRALEIKGSAAALASHLGVMPETVTLWKQARATVPPAIVEKLLDVLLAADIASLASEAVAGGRLGRVLIIDDEPASAYSLARIVKQLGYEVETVTDGASALPAARRLRPDVIFMDLRMPGADGVEVARALKAEGLGSHIVAASAYASELQRERTTAAGFAAHLLKPIDRQSVEDLLTALH